ncbi:MAG: DMT family protein [Rhizomicrobium sp.]
MTWSMIYPILLLCVSNVFMTFAWYGQLRFPTTPVWILVIAGWGIAFFEYCFAVPANHFGQRVYSPVQLKTIQEIVTLIVFAIFSLTYLGEAIRWNHAAAFACLVLAAYFSFLK